VLIGGLGSTSSEIGIPVRDRHASIGDVDSVRYEGVAPTYQAGRDPVAQVDDWRQVVRLPETDDLRVVDLGSGTGIFVRAWSVWGASTVVGVDPSWSMLSVAVQAGLPDNAVQVVGRAEQVPLDSGSFDAAWLSTVIHHVENRSACAAEVARLLVPSGRVYLRGFFAGLSRVGWLGFFPGAGRAVGRFPTAPEIVELFEDAGFELVGIDEVVGEVRPIAAIRTWIEAMRHADTLLSALTDSEIASGLAALEESTSTVLGSALHLITLQWNGSP
jgi:SAM-dependent methyltransferase